MTKTIGYIAAWEHTASLEEQRAIIEPRAGEVFCEGNTTLSKAKRAFRDANRALGPGDTLLLHGCTVLALEPTSLIRIFHDLLSRGIIIESLAEPLRLTPGESEAARIFATLEIQRKLAFGLRTREALDSGSKPGRNPMLTADQAPEIARVLEEHRNNVPSAARSLGVGRATLYKFVKQHLRGTLDQVEEQSTD